MEEAFCTLVLEDTAPPGMGQGRKERVGCPAGAHARVGGALSGNWVSWQDPRHCDIYPVGGVMTHLGTPRVFVSRARKLGHRGSC